MQDEIALWKKVLSDAIASGEIGPQLPLTIETVPQAIAVYCDVQG